MVSSTTATASRASTTPKLADPRRWSHHWRTGGPITGDEMVPSHWRNSHPGGPIPLAGDILDPDRSPRACGCTTEARDDRAVAHWARRERDGSGSSEPPEQAPHSGVHRAILAVRTAEVPLQGLPDRPHNRRHDQEQHGKADDRPERRVQSSALFGRDAVTLLAHHRETTDDGRRTVTRLGWTYPRSGVDAPMRCPGSS